MSSTRSDWTKLVILPAGVIVISLGVAVMIGWSLHIMRLIQVFPALVPMQRMTALGFILSGSAIVLAATGRRRASLVLALIVMGEAILVCLEYALKISLGVDQLLGRDYINVRTPHLGRMTPVTALCFLGASIAILSISSPKLGRYSSAISGALASVLLAVGSVSFLGYLLGHTETYGWIQLTRMALHTSAGFVLLGLGSLALAWRESHAKDKDLPEWLPLGLGLALATGVLGLWQALMAHQESDLPLISGVILWGGFLSSLLVAVAVAQALRARVHNRELQEGKDVLERVFEAPPDTLVLTDRQGRIVRVNKQVEAAFGYLPSALIGTMVEALISPGLRERHRAHREAFYESPVSRIMGSGVDLHALRKDGSEFPAEISMGPVQSGGEMQVLSVVRDITERRQAQEALRVSEERFRSIFEQGAIGIALLGADHHLFKANPTFCRMLGYSEEELAWLTPIDVTLPEDRDASANFWSRLFSGKLSVNQIEKRYVKKNGEIMWGSLSASIIYDQEGRPLFGLELLEDITERKRTEEQLRSLSERLALATRSASIGIWDLDLRTNFTVWDDTTFDMVGIPKVVPMPLEDFIRCVHPDDLAAVNASLRRAIEGKTRDFVEFRVIRPDGSLRHIASAEGVVFDDQGNVIRVVGTAVDITGRKEMEAQIEASREQVATAARLSALGVMAGGVAHEINNPLAIIHASASNLLRLIREDGPLPRDQAVRNTERILDTVGRITRIIKSMRHLAREGSHDAQRPALVAKIVEGALEVCKEQFKHHSVNLFLPKIDPDLLVSCREVQIGQVLLNLLQNSFDAVAEQAGEKWIRLEVGVDHGSVAFSVIDSGPGIPAELRTKIMDPFFTTKEVGKGTGLGLSLSRKIVEEHGGKLELTERAGHPCFSFFLPLAQKQEAVCN